jgi:hypothetical protein
VRLDELAHVRRIHGLAKRLQQASKFVTALERKHPGFEPLSGARKCSVELAFGGLFEPRRKYLDQLVALTPHLREIVVRTDGKYVRYMWRECRVTRKHERVAASQAKSDQRHEPVESSARSPHALRSQLQILAVLFEPGESSQVGD